MDRSTRSLPTRSSLLPSREPVERYEVQETLGRGGVAVVYAAIDRATGRKLAIKRLRAQLEPEARERVTERFESEFQTLSQLAHPNIVQVYDYGIDEAGPYYTMELVEGGDLSQLAPLPWREACAIGRDLCSALSLLHSRRLVHRDLTPRNVRCSAERQAKLIDFGALAAFGSNKHLVGTPNYCAPEIVHLQPLDGRTDLYGLGATLYYLVLGRHAYMARDFQSLSESWLEGAPRPLELDPSLPEALEVLLLDLLRLEPDARPASAGEVMERLAAIDGSSLAEQQHVARAYLATPTLVGREESLARVRRKLERTLRRGRGNSVVVSGDAGAGRSRLLDTCVVEATLLGASAVRVDADDAASGDFGVMRSVARQLMTMRPQAAAAAAAPSLVALSRFDPETFAPDSLPLTAAHSRHPAPLLSLPPGGSLAPRPPNEAGAARMQLQAALQNFMTAICRDCPLLVAVDDYHRIDEPSAALLALLAHDSADGLCLLASVETAAPSRVEAAQRWLLDASAHVQLEPLSPVESEQLLKSLFGDVPNLSALAHRLHALAAGNPRDLLGLAQHLVDRAAVRYAAGTWTLPAQIDPSDVPGDLAHALRARVDALRQPVRQLAAAFALCPDQSFTLAECELISERKGAALMFDLDQAVSAQVVRGVDGGFALARPVWVSALRASLSAELERVLHAGLAEIFERRGVEFRAGQHWLRAGEAGRALDVLVAHARTSQHQTAKSSEAFYRYAGALPSDWFETFEDALRACSVLGRPARDQFTLRSRLAGLVSAFSVADRGNSAALFAQLARDSGLEDWQTLSDSFEPEERIRRALSLAEVRYAETPERERVLAPQEAIAALSRMIATATSIVTISLDAAYLRSFPDVRPFAPISPALAIMQRLLEGMRERYSGRQERAEEIYRDVLDRTAQPDRAGLDASHCELTRLAVMNALDVFEACMGGERRDFRARTASHPAFALNAVATRALQHLFRGDVKSAEQCRTQLERMRLEARQIIDGATLSWEVVAHVIAEDLTRVRQTFPQLAELAQRYRPWRAVQHYAVAAYHRIRRDAMRALPEIEAALAGARAGEHVLWCPIAAEHLRILCELGRYAEALSTAELYVSDAEHRMLGYQVETLKLALAVCQAQARSRHAAQTASASIARLLELGVQGLHLGSAYESAARVALLEGDLPLFEQHAERSYEAYGCYRHPALLAKYRRLNQEAERRRTPPPRDRDREPVATRQGVVIASALAQCTTAEERARTVVRLLAGEAGARGGALFTLGVDRAECIASVGDIAVPAGLVPRMSDYLLAQTHDVPTTSSDAEERAARQWTDERGQRYRPVLLCHEVTGTWVVTGAALLRLDTAADYVSPTRIASVISRAWAETGGVAMLFASDD